MKTAKPGSWNTRPISQIQQHYGNQDHQQNHTNDDWSPCLHSWPLIAHSQQTLLTECMIQPTYSPRESCLITHAGCYKEHHYLHKPCILSLQKENKHAKEKISNPSTHYTHNGKRTVQRCRYLQQVVEKASIDQYHGP